MPNKQHMKMLWGVGQILFPIGMLFIGWVWLLDFPWSWLVKLIICFEVMVIALVLFSEYQASDVNGAGGWMAFAFMMLHLYAAVILGVIRFLFWLWSYFVG